MRGFEASKKAVFWTPCETCKARLVNPDGSLGRERLPEEEPNCHACPKLTHLDVWADDRVLRAITLTRMGLTDEDDIIRRDSWLHSAVRLIRSTEEKKQMRELEQQIKRERGPQAFRR